MLELAVPCEISGRSALAIGRSRSTCDGFEESLNDAEVTWPFRASLVTIQAMDWPCKEPRCSERVSWAAANDAPFWLIWPAASSERSSYVHFPLNRLQPEKASAATGRRTWCIRIIEIIDQLKSA